MTSHTLEIVLLLATSAALTLLHFASPTEAAATSDSLSLVVEDVQATTATVSWQPPSSNDVIIKISLRVTSQPSDENTTWTEEANSQSRTFIDLEQFTKYTVCITAQQDNNNANGSVSTTDECATFKTDLTMRTVAAFGCSTFLVLSFCTVTVLDLIYGSVRPNEEKQKQDELLEEGAKTFRRKKGKKKRRKKKESNADAVDDSIIAATDDKQGIPLEEEEVPGEVALMNLSTQERESKVVDKLLRESGLEHTSAVRFEETSPPDEEEETSARDSVVVDDEGSLTMGDL